MGVSTTHKVKAETRPTALATTELFDLQHLIRSGPRERRKPEEWCNMRNANANNGTELAWLRASGFSLCLRSSRHSPPCQCHDWPSRLTSPGHWVSDTHPHTGTPTCRCTAAAGLRLRILTREGHMRHPMRLPAMRPLRRGGPDPRSSGLPHLLRRRASGCAARPPTCFAPRSNTGGAWPLGPHSCAEPMSRTTTATRLRQALA